VKDFIEVFLEGKDPQRYITSVEGDYYTNSVTLFIDDPVKGKYTEKHHYTPYLFMKDLKQNKIQLYQSKEIRDKAIEYYGIKIEKLRTDNNLRLENGFKYLVTSTKSVGALINFFKKGGYDPFERKDLFIINRPEEQFLIQTGKRLFKGFEYYKDVHKLYFDLETTGIDPKTQKIFLIGIKDNRGFQHVIEIDDNDDSEIEGIEMFFRIINEIKPSIISGYNSENFDFPFIIERCNRLGIDLNNCEFPTSLDKKKPIRKKKGFLKMASETEEYFQTIMYGYNVTDVAHSVRRTMAINSDIKTWGLKYITKYAKKNKPNRMYVDGDKIYQIYKENKRYKIDRKTNNYQLIKDNEYVSSTEDTITGKEIVRQYLLDDLWETEQVDEIFNQASFLLSSLIPSSLGRTSTMGTAVTWKILMMAYSYENKISIPNNDKKRDMVGGLSRLFKIGYGENIVKLDFASLYPSIMIEHDVFPDCDIDHVMKKLITYFSKTRNKYKHLKEKYKKENNEELSNYYNVRQLPLKILNNGFFGSLSAPEVFNWGDMDCGERITCTGRQYLRKMIKYFVDNDFILLQTDTDGGNYSVPDSHKNKIEELVEYFNKTYMKGFMNLDIDKKWKSSINMKRKNYVNLTYEGKSEITGNTLKSNKIQRYLEEFIDKSVNLLLNNKPKEFVEYYYEYIEKIYNKQLPLNYMANKAKVKISKQDYKKRLQKTNKNGKPLPRFAYMELLVEKNIDKNLGEIVYYVNNGNKVSDQDVGNSILIDPEKEEYGHYNFLRYVNILNNRIKQLLTCFQKEVRDTLLVKNPKDKQYYTEKQLKLQMEDLDTIEETMNIDQRELDFWNKIGKNPREIFDGFTTNNCIRQLDITRYDNIISDLKGKFKKEGVNIKSYKENYNNGEFVILPKIENGEEKWILSEVVGGEFKEIDEMEVIKQ